MVFFTQKAFGFFQGALQVRSGFNGSEPGANGDERVRDDRGNARENHIGAEESDCFDGTNQAVGGFPFNIRDSCKIDHHGAGTLRVDRIEQLISQLCGPRPVNPPNQRHDQQTVLRLENRSRKFLDNRLELSALGPNLQVLRRGRNFP